MSNSLLALDPSSTACGIAHFPSITGKPPPDFLDVIRPPAAWPAIRRIDAIVAGVLDVVRRFRSVVVVMEYSSGKVAGKNRERHPSGLAVMGQCQGEVRRALMMQDWSDGGGKRPRIETVDESWTHKVPKNERALRLAAEFPVYREFLAGGKDGTWRGKGEWKGGGLDVADSIGICLWWMGQQATMEAIKHAERK